MGPHHWGGTVRRLQPAPHSSLHFAGPFLPPLILELPMHTVSHSTCGRAGDCDPNHSSVGSEARGEECVECGVPVCKV